jgi:hypothetical protein
MSGVPGHQQRSLGFHILASEKHPSQIESQAADTQGDSQRTGRFA